MPHGQNLSRCSTCGRSFICGDHIVNTCPDCKMKIGNHALQILKDRYVKGSPEREESIRNERESVLLAEKDKEIERLNKIRKIAEDLVGFTSYAEITSGILVNRAPIRKLCDEFTELNKPFRAREIDDLCGSHDEAHAGAEGEG